MGFDCTLHLVDERAVREEFVPRHLERSAGPTALDRVMKNADEVWGSPGGPPGRRPRRGGLTRLPVGRHVFGLFAPAPVRTRVRPVALGGSGNGRGHRMSRPVRVFAGAPLRGRRGRVPRPGGRFPRWFAGNYSTGVFVPAVRVPEVLAWVEQQVGGFAKGDRRQFKGLLAILRTAAGKGLAYWEATDLAVPMADQYPGDPGPDARRAHLGNEPGSAGRAAEAAPLTAHAGILGRRLLDHWFVSAAYQPFGTNVWDLSAWPPRLAHTMSEYAPSTRPAPATGGGSYSPRRTQGQPAVVRPRLSDLGRPPELVAPVVIGGVEYRASPTADSSATGCSYSSPAAHNQGGAPNTAAAMAGRPRLAAGPGPAGGHGPTVRPPDRGRGPGGRPGATRRRGRRRRLGRGRV